MYQLVVEATRCATVADQHVADQHAADQHVADQHVADQHVADQHAAMVETTRTFVQQPDQFD